MEKIGVDEMEMEMKIENRERGMGEKDKACLVGLLEIEKLD